MSHNSKSRTQRFSLSSTAWSSVAAILLIIVVGPAAVYLAPPESQSQKAPTVFKTVSAVVQGSDEGSILSEVAQLNSAFRAYKEKHGSYPPSDFTKLDDTKSPQYTAMAIHLMKAFPRCNVETETAAIKKLGIKSPAQALFFWLSGFHEDPEHPISGWVNNSAGKRESPLFEFDTKRLKYPTGENGAPIYLPPGRTDVPYIYFSSVSYEKQAPFNAELKQGGKGTAKPYRADKGAEGEFINPKSFQIISAGSDGDYGGGAGSFPSGEGYEAGDKDNLTNFSAKTLGESIPK